MLDEHTDGELFYKIKEGVGDFMPAFEDQLPDEDIWDIVNYLRSAGASEGAEKTPVLVDNDTTEDGGSGTTLYLGILLVALALAAYFIKRRR